MPEITVKNVPDKIITALRLLAATEKTSFNVQLLRALEKGLEVQMDFFRKNLNKDIQVRLWKNLCGRWKDHRGTAEIIRDIYESRTVSRRYD
jgi:hypothetical protein